MEKKDLGARLLLTAAAHARHKAVPAENNKKQNTMASSAPQGIGTIVFFL